MLVTDTETTGLLAPESANLYAQPWITEIYVGKFNEKFKLVDEFHSLVKPGIPIPEFITKITGISDDTVKNAPSFIEIYDDLYEFFLGEDEILGQNINFDMDCIRHSLSRIGKQFHFPYPRSRIDTVELSFPIMNRRMKLGELHKYLFDFEFKEAHTAKADAMATVKCYAELKKRGF